MGYFDKGLLGGAFDLDHDGKMDSLELGMEYLFFEDLLSDEEDEELFFDEEDEELFFDEEDEDI